jgi:cobalt-zinc-cadmium efflux system membrane fusion protein
MQVLSPRVWRVARAAGLGVLILAVAGSAAWLASGSSKPSPGAGATASQPDSLRRVGPDGVFVPADVVAKAGLTVEKARTPASTRKLAPFTGTLAVDPDTTIRYHTPFPGDVVELGTTPDTVVSTQSDPRPQGPPRPLRKGDRVKAGQLLAVVWNSSLGEKKSALLDALSKLRRDQDYLDGLRTAGASIPPVQVRAAEQQVESDRIAVRTAEATLRVSRVSPEEIMQLWGESRRLSDPHAAPNPANWARVEIRAKADGVIVQKDVTAGQFVDTPAELFVIADLSRLAVWAHVYEEQVHHIQDAKQPVQWTVTVAGRPGESYPGTLESIGAVLDLPQRTALITGSVDNAKGKLIAGMSVTVTVEVPAPAGEVELPAEAVIEDGQESFVFVQPDPANKTVYLRRKVRVTRRDRDVIYVAAEPDGVKPGDLVLVSGGLSLNEAMRGLPQPRP